MSFLDRLFGRDPQPEPQQSTWSEGQAGGGPARPADMRSPDEIALERYRYLLKTAPAEEIEHAHEEAFSKLTPEQRRLALEQLAAYVPEGELRNASDDPQSLARVATRAELRQPGTIERALGGPAGAGGRPAQAGSGGGFGGGGGGGFGLGSILLYSLAGSFIGSAIAQSMFGSYGYPPGDPAADAGSNFDQAGYDSGDSGDAGGDSAGDGVDAGDGGATSSGGWGDPGGGDVGSDFETADAGDFGGGDFGGGDFGGGDFGGGDF